MKTPAVRTPPRALPESSVLPLVVALNPSHAIRRPLLRFDDSVRFSLDSAGAGQEENQETPMLQVGQRAPDFSLTDHTGQRVSLTDLRGKKVWLWFFTSPGGNN